MKIILEGSIVVPEEDLEAVLSELPKHVKLTRAEPGCLVFKVTQHADDACKFDVYEEFENRAAFEAHQTRVRASEWGQIAQNVTRHYTVREA